MAAFGPSLAVDETPVRRPTQHAGKPRIDRLSVSAYTIPTDRPESDGTLAWDSTTIVVVGAEAGGVRGLGYSYADVTAARLASTLGAHVVGRDAFETAAIWTSMVGAVRNMGRPGIAATAISAIDAALWDLKARLLSVPLIDLLGRAREEIAAYGSGGFCSYDADTLTHQMTGWADAGFRFVKMKVGRDPTQDPKRVAIVREGAPNDMAIAAGEYGWDQFHFRGLLEAGAVDVLQVDATRCLGITGFLMAAALCEAYNTPLSSHCAPALHAHLMCATPRAIHLEWFHDHVRIESMLFDGAARASKGSVAPDRARPGLGVDLKPADAEPYLVWRSA